MKTTITLPRRAAGMAALGLLLSLLSLAVTPVRAQTVGGTGFAVLVNAGGLAQQSSVAVLPRTGGYAVGDDVAFGVPGSVASQALTSVTTGAVDVTRSTSQTTSSAENVSLLNGLIRADIVSATTSSYRTATRAFSDADGSGFAGLVVNGVALTDPAPNTRVALPGVGFAVLNEQLASGDGVTSSGITVNLIHVVLQDALTGAKTGEIIVGSASSRVGL